jgi:hypothetical protein
MRFLVVSQFLMPGVEIKSDSATISAIDRICSNCDFDAVLFVSSENSSGKKVFSSAEIHGKISPKDGSLGAFLVEMEKAIKRVRVRRKSECIFAVLYSGDDDFAERIFQKLRSRREICFIPIGGRYNYEEYGDFVDISLDEESDGKLDTFMESFDRYIFDRTA